MYRRCLCGTTIDLNTIEAHPHRAHDTDLSIAKLTNGKGMSCVELQPRPAAQIQFFFNPEKLCPLGLVKVPLCLQLSPALVHAAADVGKFFLQRATADEQLAFAPGTPASLAPPCDRPLEAPRR
jgi:hypothetical protein